MIDYYSIKNIKICPIVHPNTVTITLGSSVLPEAFKQFTDIHSDVQFMLLRGNFLGYPPTQKHFVTF